MLIFSSTSTPSPSSLSFNPFSTQLAFVLGIALTHVQDFAHGLAELHEFLRGPPLKPVQVLLDGMHSLQCVHAHHKA